MSHELRTPLNSMLLLSHLLADNEAGNLTAKQVEHSKTIHGAGQDLLALINQVLDLSKIEAGKQEYELEPVTLAHFAEHSRRVFSPLAQEKKLKFAVEVMPGMPATIVTDRLRVERILTNLLGNAIKFTDHGEVALRIGRPSPGCRFERRDLVEQDTVAFAVSTAASASQGGAGAGVRSPFRAGRRTAIGAMPAPGSAGDRT
jgi:signal transduction histidine kinase